MELPITLAVDEIGFLPQVSSVEELRDAPFSCFTEVLPHRRGPVATLFPDASSRHGGDVAAPGWWSDTDSELRVLHLFKIRDAFVFPEWGVVMDRSGRVMRLTMEEAAYASPDLTALPNVVRRASSPVFDVPDAVERIGKVAVTLPSGARKNYGHFVLDCLPGIVAIDDAGVFDGFAYVMPPLTSWQRRHLAILGARPHETVAPILLADEVIYSNAVHHFLHTPNLSYRRLRSRQVAGVGEGAAGGSRRIYLSRGPRTNRVMLSEPRLRRGLVRAGFDVVDTEGMSVDEQVARFAAAEIVIGSAGAALANAVFCRPGATVIEIQPSGMENLWVQRLCFINGLHYAAWFCDAVADDPRHPERQLRFDLDVGRFVDFVSARFPLKGTGAQDSRRRGLMRRLLRKAGRDDASSSS